MATRSLITAATRGGWCLSRKVSAFGGVGLAEELAKLSKLAPRQCFSRSLATEVPMAATALLIRTIPPEPPKVTPKFYTKQPTVVATIYKFPTLEPLIFQTYPSTFLRAELCRDTLHRAIIFEGDNSRTARPRTKTRSEIHGSGRKLRPQKGTGRARIGDRSSPVLRGGAAAHGPKAKDHRTKIPRKLYDQAFRIALSYRYRRGDLIVVDDISGHVFPDVWYVKEILTKNRWGRENKNTIFITAEENAGLSDALHRLEKEGRALTVNEVDCKNLLEMGRVVIEARALDHFLQEGSPTFPIVVR